MEQGITLAVEEQLRGLDGVKRVTSNSSEGGAAVSAELVLSVNPDKVLSDAKSAIDRITTLPADAEGRFRRASCRGRRRCRVGRAARKVFALQHQKSSSQPRARALVAALRIRHLGRTSTRTLQH